MQVAYARIIKTKEQIQQPVISRSLIHFIQIIRREESLPIFLMNVKYNVLIFSYKTPPKNALFYNF